MTHWENENFSYYKSLMGKFVIYGPGIIKNNPMEDTEIKANELCSLLNEVYLAGKNFKVE